MLNYRIAAALAVIALTACANEVQPRAEFETLAAQTPWKVENGRETRDMALHGVAISQERIGDRVNTLTIDQSGHGAVMCSWKVYAAVLMWAELCQPEEKEWQGHLSTALERINAFIVANNLTPITKQEMEARLAKELSPVRDGRNAMPAQAVEKACRNNRDAGKMFGDLKRNGYGRLQAEVDKLLSVPRPPALNPCF